MTDWNTEYRPTIGEVAVALVLLSFVGVVSDPVVSVPLLFGIGTYPVSRAIGTRLNAIGYRRKIVLKLLFFPLLVASGIVAVRTVPTMTMDVIAGYCVCVLSVTVLILFDEFVE